ncbi:MAG: SAM-dependent chlorinase/fluorinase [Elusimicrobiota bacterium]
MSGVIALLTDFGHKDPFAGIMKGVILARCPWARVVDLCHGVPPQDVRAGALRLMAAVPYFPKGTLFVCVVDPGVGSERAILWARGARGQFLAPDNGLLSWASRVEPLREVRRVANARLFLDEVSRTFHGRDIFAPVAAALACGVPPSELGPRRRKLVRLPFPEARRRGGRVRGEVIAFDGFGNAVTNLRPADLRPNVSLEACGLALGPLRRAYASVPSGGPLALVGSYGFVELSVRDGNFAAKYRVQVGEPVFALRRSSVANP